MSSVMEIAMKEMGQMIELANVSQEYLDDNFVKNDNLYDFMSRQALINGNFDIAQRGTTFTNPSIGSYTLDRWKVVVVSSGVLPTLVHSQAPLTSGDIGGSYNRYRINTSGAGSGFGASDGYTLAQTIENGTRYLCGAGKKITVSFYARSDIAGKRLGVNTSQSYGSGGTPSGGENHVGQLFTLTPTWTRYSVTITTSTLAGKTFGTNNDDVLAVNFSVMFGTNVAINRFGIATSETFGAAGNIEIAQVQLNAGDVPLPYQPRSFSEELALCQRYYEKSYSQGVAPGTALQTSGIQAMLTTTSVPNGTLYGKVKFSVKKRVPATVTIYPLTTPANTGRVSDAGGVDLAANSGVYSSPGDDGFVIANNSGGTLTPTNGGVIFHWVADAEL